MVYVGGGREERAGTRIPKVAGSGEKRGKLCNTAQFCNQKKKAGAGGNKNRAGTRIKGYREAGGLNFPVPPPPTPTIENLCGNK